MRIFGSWVSRILLTIIVRAGRRLFIHLRRIKVGKGSSSHDFGAKLITTEMISDSLASRKSESLSWTGRISAEGSCGATATDDLSTAIFDKKWLLNLSVNVTAESFAGKVGGGARPVRLCKCLHRDLGSAFESPKSFPNVSFLQAMINF